MRSDRLPLVLVLVLVLLAAGSGAWLLLGSEAPVETATVGAAATPGSTTTGERLASDPERAAAPDTPQRTSVDLAASAEVPFPLENAQWVEVRVVLPQGTPLDEEVQVLGTSRSLRAEAQRSPPMWLVAHGRPPVFRAGRRPDDTYRVAFGPEMAKGDLDLDAHYLYLSAPVELDLPAPGPITLEPLLGARLKVRFDLPAQPPEGFEIEHMEYQTVRLMGLMVGRGDEHQTEASLYPTLSIDVGGLRPGLGYFMHGNLRDFVDVQEMLPALEAGQTLEHRYQLVTGATLRGRVLDESGTPVARAEVDYDSEAKLAGFFGGFGTLDGDARADDEGCFELRGVPPAKATLTASKEGYLDSEERELELADLDVVEGLELVLPSGSRISGRVTFPDDRPAAGARIVLKEKESRDLGARQWSFDHDHDAKADDDGRFSVGGLGQGPFSVRAEATRTSEEAFGDRVTKHRTETWRTTAEDVRPGAELARGRAAPIVVTGRAGDDTGAPVTRFRVRTDEAEDEELPWGRLSFGHGGGDEVESEDGTFEVRTLGRGTWELTLEADGHGDSQTRTLTLPGEVGPFTFVLPRAGTLAGLVLDPSGQPASGAQVALTRPSSGLVFMLDDESEETDAEGRFRFEGVAPGAVELVARSEGLASSEPLALEVVPAQPQEGLELRLRLGGTLTGEVYNPDGTADAGRQVMVQQPMTAAESSNATTDGAGFFRIEHLAPGSYQVAAFPDIDFDPDQGEQPDPVEMIQQMRMTTAEIREGEVTHVVLGAPPSEPVALTGVVREAGRPAAGLVVMALAEGEAMLSNLRSARTAADGTFALTLPAPGDWILLAGQELDGEGSEFPITVPAGESHHVELEIPGGRISGRVRAPDGSPAAGVQVSLNGGRAVSIFNTSGGRERTSDEDGRFAFEHAQPGTYELRAGGAGAMALFGGGETRYGMALLSGLVLEEGGALDGLELNLTEPGTITGIVRHADGSAAAKATVWVRDAAGRVLNTRSWCSTDGAGRFSFRGAGRGRYTVLARSASAASQEVAVDVSEGVESTVELELEEGTILLVAIEDDEGNALRADLRIYDDAGREVSGLSGMQEMERVLTSGFSTREQRVGPLAPGRYRVEAVAEDGSRAAKPVHLSGQVERRVRLRLKD